MGHIVAGPTAGLIFADLGADVIKVENPDRGDQARTAPSRSFPFFNRNKRSLALDLKSTAGKEIFLRLARTADVVVDNFAQGAVEDLGVGYASLTKVNSKVIYLSIKGFLQGPYEQRPAMDELAQMMGGLAFMTGPAGTPMRAGASLIDIGAATYGVIAVMAALLRRQQSGVGEEIRAGLYETTVFLVGQWMAQAASLSTISRPMPELRMGPLLGWGVYDLFLTADRDHVFVGLTTDAHWQRFCEQLELPDLFADPALASNQQRVDARRTLLPRLAEEIGVRGTADLVTRLERAAVPFAQVKRPDELFDDPHLIASGQLLITPIPGRGPAGLPKLPTRSDRYGFTLRRPAPGLGEHSRELLHELGCADDEIASLAAQRVIGLGTSTPAD